MPKRGPDPLLPRGFSVVLNVDVPRSGYIGQYNPKSLAGGRWSLAASSNRQNDENGYYEEKVKHRTWSALLRPEQFRKLVRALDLRICCENTLGMLGALGADGLLGHLPAVSLGAHLDPAEGIIGAYVCPLFRKEDVVAHGRIGDYSLWELAKAHLRKLVEGT